MKKYNKLNLLILLVISILLCMAVGIRLIRLSSMDLWVDEALSTLISQSLMWHGELHSLRYSDSVPSFHYQHGMWVYFPPLYYFLQAPFMLLKDILHPNIVARMPALLSGLLLIVILYFISKNLWKSRVLGLVTALFATLNGFQIYMSRSAETYSLLPASLCLAFYFLLNALKNQDKKYWVLSAAFLTISYYINQMSLLFIFVWIAGFMICCRNRRYQQAKNLFIYSLLSLILCSPWLFIQSHALLPQINQASQNYISAGKLLRILGHYYSMLGHWIFVMFFLIGFGKILYSIINKNKSFESLLLAWLFLPFLYFFSKTMWINHHHMFFVFPPVILMTAYGAYYLFRFPLEWIILRYLSLDRSAYNAVFLTVFLVSSLLQLKFVSLERVAGAALEFGKPIAVSLACDYIKKNYAGEIIIAPIGASEAYYLNMFVYDKNKDDAVQRSFRLVSERDAWVFMGDNYFKLGRLDEFDRYVQRNGTLIMHTEPVKGFTDADNKLGYALYRIRKQDISGYDLNTDFWGNKK